jgi:hypothetical protein
MVVSGGIMFIPSFVKNWSVASKDERGDTQMYTETACSSGKLDRGKENIQSIVPLKKKLVEFVRCGRQPRPPPTGTWGEPACLKNTERRQQGVSLHPFAQLLN